MLIEVHPGMHRRKMRDLIHIVGRSAKLSLAMAALPALRVQVALVEWKKFSHEQESIEDEQG
jgi:hypothetical protein